jgi:serine/threonine protein kinase
MLQRSNYVIGKGGCATVYLGRIVDFAVSPLDGISPQSQAGAGNPSSPPSVRPESDCVEDSPPPTSSSKTARASEDETSPGVSSVTSSHDALPTTACPTVTSGGECLTGKIACAALDAIALAQPRITLVAVKKKFHTHRGHHSSPSPRKAALDAEHVVMESIPAHPNVMPVLAVVHVEGHAHFAMPLMDSDLGHELRRHHARPTEAQALHLTRDLLRGVAHAHSHGIAHRDVKPSNALLVRDAGAAIGVRAVLSDFGVAHRVDSDVAHLASNGCGTLYYQPPEQLLGQMRAHDARRCDIWAIGCVLFELLSGQQAFVAGTAIETLGVIMRSLGTSFQDYPNITAPYPPPILARLARDRPVSPVIADLLLALLHVNSEKRPSAHDALGHAAFAQLDLASADGESAGAAAAAAATAGIPMQLRGYTVLPAADSLAFAALHSACIDLSDVTSDASTCRKSRGTTERRAHQFDPRAGAPSASRGAQPPIADGRRITLTSLSVNALFWSSSRNRCGAPAEHVVRSVSARSPGKGASGASEPYGPMEGPTSSRRSAGTLAQTRSADRHLHHQPLDFSPISNPPCVSPQRRALCFDSDDDSPVYARRLS